MNVFISYRRSDTQDLAGRLADRLRAVGQIQRVFIDVDEIAPGTDFAAAIQAAIDECSVCLAVIGPQWRGADGSGRTARILDDADFVRQEVAAALKSRAKVVPVLANGVTMPAANDLPADLRGLPALNGVSLRHAYFDHDFEYLIGVVLARKKPGTIESYFRRHPIQRALVRATIGAGTALALLVVAAAIHASVLAQSLEETLGGPGLVWLVGAGTVATGALLALRRGGQRQR
jgi:hypothetical protein